MKKISALPCLAKQVHLPAHLCMNLNKMCSSSPTSVGEFQSAVSFKPSNVPFYGSREFANLLRQCLTGTGSARGRKRDKICMPSETRAVNMIGLFSNVNIFINILLSSIHLIQGISHTVILHIFALSPNSILLTFDTEMKPRHILFHDQTFKRCEQPG